MRHLTRIAAVATATIALIVGVTAAAFACHNTVRLILGPCDTHTGEYQIAATITNSEANSAETLSEATLLADQLDGRTLEGGATLTVDGLIAPGSGVVTLSVRGTWPTRHVTSTAASSPIDVPAVGACVKAVASFKLRKFRGCVPSRRAVEVVHRHHVGSTLIDYRHHRRVARVHVAAADGFTFADGSVVKHRRVHLGRGGPRCGPHPHGS